MTPGMRCACLTFSCTSRPLTSGWDTFHRIHRADFIPRLNKLFESVSFGFSPLPSENLKYN